jgi:predicted dehydrogenase/threonine dehydrogenase-like Zn-dependent dehydrogenase
LARADFERNVSSMKGVIQNLWNGDVAVADQPAPQLSAGHVLLRTRCSLISSGTERMLVEFGRSSLLQKAWSQPERVRQVLEKARTLGVVAAWDSVHAKMDEPLALGYCNAGIVVDRAPDVTEFSINDRVASNGHHAEFVVVPRTLCAKVPDSVSDEDACFTPLAAIGLEGVRLLAPTLGESVGVIGLGLVGLLAAQLLKASGCRVIGFDFNKDRLALAERLGVETMDLGSSGDPVKRGVSFSGGGGLDGVIIGTSTTSGTPITQAAEMCRQRGRIVLIGVCGMELDRQQFFKKELTFQVSCSYGPGRYDEEYERLARDYPRGFVRWTAQRNFEAVLASMASKALDVGALISDRFSQERASDAYARLLQPDSLGIVLEYPRDSAIAHRVDLPPARAPRQTPAAPAVRVGLIGSGAFARSTILPLLRSADVELCGVVSHAGLSAAQVARKFAFKYCASDPDEILGDADVNAIFITTPHDTHAALVTKALAAGKHVFVEKPLCINDDQLDAIVAAYREFAVPRGLQLAVGFNRRFSPLAEKLASLVHASASPRAMVFTVNAGVAPAGHWVNDAAVSGGRIVGEACHFIDLLTLLAASPIAGVQASSAGTADQMSITLRYKNGSIGTVHYLTSGHRSFPKEHLSVFVDQAVYVLDDFRSLRGFGARGFTSQRLWSQDKGHAHQISRFLQRVRQGGAPLMPFETLVNVTRASFAAVRAAQTGQLEMRL